MVTCGPATNTGLSMEKPEQEKSKFILVIEFIKVVFLCKETRLWAILMFLSTVVSIYLLTINFHWWDLIIQPLVGLAGWRMGAYGLLGLIPGGGYIHDRHFSTMRFWPVLKTWRTRWMFLRENNFSVDFYYRKKEMYKGDPTSVREVTGPAVVTIGIGFNKYLFDLE